MHTPTPYTIYRAQYSIHTGTPGQDADGPKAYASKNDTRYTQKKPDLKH